jgi:hypothetical protein
MQARHLESMDVTKNAYWILSEKPEWEIAWVNCQYDWGGHTRRSILRDHFIVYYPSPFALFCQ